MIHYAISKFVIDGKEEKAPYAIGSIDLSKFEYFAKGSVWNDKAFISCSETVLISHPRCSCVLNYMKLRIYDNDNLELFTQYIDPKIYDVKIDETFFASINNVVMTGRFSCI